MLLKITIDPDPGYAVKEIFYTYNPTTNALYAIFPQYPSNKKLIVKDIALPAGTTIRSLSSKQSLNWNQVGKNVEISLPDYDPNTKAPYAYAVKIENYGRFAKKPAVKVIYDAALKPTVTINNDDAGAIVYYTTDGSTPGISSAVYNKPFTVDSSAVVKAISIKTGLLSSDVQALKVRVYTTMKAAKVFKPAAGLQYSYSEDPPTGTYKMHTVKMGTVNNFNLNNKTRKSIFSFVFTGYIDIKTTGMYDFYTTSDDGSVLYIDDQLIVDNNGDHGMEEKSDKAVLEKGFHKIKVVYYDSGGDNGLKVSYNLSGQPKMEIPATVLFH